MFLKGTYHSSDKLYEHIAVARGEQAADLVVKHARFLDVMSGSFIEGDIATHQGMIVGTIDSYEGRQVIDGTGLYVVPGFIDSHVHIESSMMTPARFQQAVLPCGTTTVIWDPHEIANVKGTAGIEWALSASDKLDLDFLMMLPSCVPSTTFERGFESSGAVLYAKDLHPFKNHPRVLGLAEMMNFPGLLHGDREVLEKLFLFQDRKRDGHCPALLGKDLNAYGVAGIHSCHESTSSEEALEKLHKGIHVLIREGSCAKDGDALLPLLNSYTSAVLGLCSDDRNPLDIANEGHIDFLINKALRAGHEASSVFRAASFAAARAYGLEDRGVIAPGFIADFILVKPKQGQNWQNGFEVQQVFKRGHKVDRDVLRAIALARSERHRGKNLFLDAPTTSTFKISSSKIGKEQEVRVIGVIPNQIVTDELTESLAILNGQFKQDIKRDILKITVLERHHHTNSHATAFVKGFGLREGAIATSVNHDCHNVMVVGATDAAMVLAVSHLISIDGGIVVVDGEGQILELSLPIGGLMSDAEPQQIAEKLRLLKQQTQRMGCKLAEPFLTLSFLALPVIPSLKITDKGLVDVKNFKLVSVTK